MMEELTKTLVSKKYDLPQVGTYTGRQIAEYLQKGNAPAEIIRLFKTAVVSVKVDTPKLIIIDCWK